MNDENSRTVRTVFVFNAFVVAITAAAIVGLYWGGAGGWSFWALALLFATGDVKWERPE